MRITQLLIVFITLIYSHSISQTQITIPIRSEGYDVRTTENASGGIISVWLELADTATSAQSLYAQSIDSLGNLLWDIRGIEVFSSITLQNTEWFNTVSDGRGGAIVVFWGPVVNGDTNFYKVYVQRLSMKGERIWGEQGKLIFCDTLVKMYPCLWTPGLLSDGHEGAFVGWHDLNYPHVNVRICRIDSTGNILWTQSTPHPYHEIFSEFCPDDSGGILFTYETLAGPEPWLLRVKHLAANGGLLWADSGIIVGALTYPQVLTSGGLHIIVKDNRGGAIIFWQNSLGGDKLYAQRINQYGDKFWQSDGILIGDGNRPSAKTFIDSTFVVTWSSPSGIRLNKFSFSGEQYWGLNDVSIDTLSSGGARLSFFDSSRSVITWTKGDSAFIAGIDTGGNFWINPIAIGTVDSPHPPLIQSHNGRGFVIWRSKFGIVAKIIDSSGFVTTEVSLSGFPPKKLGLLNNYPNPFNPTTTITYHLPTHSYVTLKVFDLLGREVTTLVDGLEEPGVKLLNWNASGLSSGIYYYRIQVGKMIETKELILLR